MAYTLHIVGRKNSFTCSSGVKRCLVPLDVVGNTKEYEAFLELPDTCGGTVNTSHFILSKIDMYNYIC